MPLTPGFGCGSRSCYFRHWPSRRQLKTNFWKKFLCYLLFEDTFTSFFKDKKSKRSHKAEGNKVFLTIFCLVIEGSRSIALTNGSGFGSRRPKNIRIRRIQIRIRNTAVKLFWGRMTWHSSWLIRFLPVSPHYHTYLTNTLFNFQFTYWLGLCKREVRTNTICE